MIGQDLAGGLRNQARVLVALMLREARTRYGRQKAGYLWALIEPIIHIAIFYVIFSTRIRYVPLGDSLAVFLATGLATFLGFRNVMSRTEGGYGSNEALLSYPVVKVIDVFVGRALLELATWITVIIIILGTLVLVGAGPFPRSLLTMLAAILLLFAMGFGAGMFLGIVTVFLPSLGSLMRAPMRLLYFLSGVFYLPDTLPPAARDVLAWNPVMHAITLFREGYYPRYDSHLLDTRYLVGWAVGCLLLGLVAERLGRKPIRSAI